MKHSTVEVNGIELHIAEQGEGPLVVLLHGFPECWYSWRHQFGPLAEAGYRVVAPDQRGYARSEQPEDVAAYSLLHLAGDVIGLIHALGEERAVLVGHDWGAPVAWTTAMLRPDVVRGVAGLSVPPVLPGGMAPPSRTGKLYGEGFYQLRFQQLGVGDAGLLEAELVEPLAVELAGPRRRRHPAGQHRRHAQPGGMAPPSRTGKLYGEGFYQLHFQQPGVADAELAADPAATFRRLLFGGSGENPGNNPPRPWILGPGEPLLGPEPAVTPLPGWLTEQDIEVFVREYAGHGARAFTGGLNWYRNIERNWELLAAFRGRRIEMPALYVAGDRDMVLGLHGTDRLLASLDHVLPRLHRSVMLPDCGHWTQQERPAEVNAALLDFLSGL